MRRQGANGELTIEELRAAFPDVEFRVSPNARIESLRWQCGYKALDANGDGELIERFALCTYAATASELCDSPRATSSQNTLLGSFAGFGLTDGGGNIIIGIVGGHEHESGFIRIANDNLQAPGTNSKVFVDGIVGRTVGALNSPVLVNGVGQLGTAVSSARFKKDIESMGKSSEAIFSLRPVTFHHKGDETNTPCFGLIAEEVAKVNPDLILLDKEGKPQTVRYEQINAMFLNEFLKEHRKNEEQQKQINALTAQLKEQAAQIQKVSAQLEASKPAPQTVLNDQ